MGENKHYKYYFEIINSIMGKLLVQFKVNDAYKLKNINSTHSISTLMYSRWILFCFYKPRDAVKSSYRDILQ